MPAKSCSLKTRPAKAISVARLPASHANRLSSCRIEHHVADHGTRIKIKRSVARDLSDTSGHHVIASNRVFAALIPQSWIAAGSVLWISISLAASAHALSLEDLSNKETVAGLKAALIQGAGRAAATLGKTDGFLGNPKVKIPLPHALQKAESVMRSMGLGDQADELITTLNRAAEAAVPEAQPVLVSAVKRMSVEDAKGVLTGGDTAATQYFRKATSEELTQRFLPIVKRATAKVRLAE